LFVHVATYFHPCYSSILLSSLPLPFPLFPFSIHFTISFVPFTQQFSRSLSTFQQKPNNPSDKQTVIISPPNNTSISHSATTHQSFDLSRGHITTKKPPRNARARQNVSQHQGSSYSYFQCFHNTIHISNNDRIWIWHSLNYRGFSAGIEKERRERNTYIDDI
jgi:hypothetical protein